MATFLPQTPISVKHFQRHLNNFKITMKSNMINLNCNIRRGSKPFRISFHMHMCVFVDERFQ